MPEIQGDCPGHTEGRTLRRVGWLSSCWLVSLRLESDKMNTRKSWGRVIHGVWAVVAAWALLLAFSTPARAADRWAPSLGDFALIAATDGRLAQGVVGEIEATAVPIAEEGSCKTVGAWFNQNYRAIRNYRVCGSDVRVEGSVAHVPRSAEARGVVRQVMRSAVLKGQATGRFEEFSIRATRVKDPDSSLSCVTELVITASGLLSFYGVQDTCL